MNRSLKEVMMKIRKLLAMLTAAAVITTSVPVYNLYAADEQTGEISEDTSGMALYKNVDYSFLKDFRFGNTYSGDVDMKVMTALEMKSADSNFLREGKIIRTNGFYTSGDGGAGTYKISASSGAGAVELDNGMYAILIPDTMEMDGNKWAVVSAKQFGAVGNGTDSDQTNLGAAFYCASEATNDDDIYRSIIYIPEGEYKCTKQLYVNIHDVNVVGDGDSTVIFTDNDYTDAYEFFMWSSGGKNLYLADFKVEARERDMSRYYRQLSFVDCENVYLYRVNMNIPQEAFSKDYYVDKQYTNLTFYSGNKNMTADSCRMELMCSTYRGANLGILDFYCRGEENITVKNCELYDNARDEQVGIFTGVNNRDASFVKNVDFIDNKIYSYTPLDQAASGGYRTMCFTVAYDESRNIDDIYIARNHFISQVDSKFMTFGNVDNCVVEDNIIEADCTGNNGSYIFEAGNASLGDIKIQNNELYVTRYGKAAICSGPIEFNGNRLVFDSPVDYLMYRLGTAENNKIVSFKDLKYLMNNTSVLRNNTLESYGNLTGVILVGGGGECGENGYIENNTIIDYKRKFMYSYDATFESLGTIRGAYVDNLYIKGNKFYAPNMYIAKGKEDNTQFPRYILYCNGAQMKKIEVSGNILQQVGDIQQHGCDMKSVTQYSDNTTVPYNDYADDSEMYTEVYMTKDGEKVTEIYTTDDKVVLGTNVKSGAKWYTSVEGLAMVDNGTVTRKQYGDVTVYVVPDNGSADSEGRAIAGRCIVHFQEAKATDISLESGDITIVKGKKHDVVYKVEPADKVSQKVVWSSSDENVAKVSDDGIIEAVDVGNAEITVATADGTNIVKKINVTVEARTVKKITLNCDVWDNNEAGVNVGETLQLEVTSYTPYDAVNKGISKWESSNEEVATVDENGFVKAVGQGHATIKAYSMDGKYYATCTVWVNPGAVTGLTEDHGQDYVTLNWDEQKNVDGYKIYLYNTETSKWDLKYTQSGTEYRAYSVKYGSYIDADKDYKFTVSPYILRVDQNGYKHYYEDMSTTIELHTYKDEVIKSFGRNIHSSIATTVGGTSNVKISINKEKYEYWIEDTDVATVKDVSPNWDADLQITGVKNGYTNLYIRSLDEKAYTQKIPILVYDFEEFELETTGGIKSVQAKWQVKDTQSISGFRFIRSWVLADLGTDIPLSDINIEKDGDVYNCSYTFTGLKNNTSYKLKIQPYVSQEGVSYAGGGSSESTFSTVEYTNVDSIGIEDIIYLTNNQKKKVSVSVGPDNATEPILSYNIYDKSVAEITSLGEVNNGEAYIELIAKKCGVTALNVIVCDDNGCAKNVKIAVVPEKISQIKGQDSSEGVVLNFDRVEGAHGYRVYKKAIGDKEWSIAGNCQSEKYVDKEVKKGTTYVYKAEAFVKDEDGEVYAGEMSDECTVTVEEQTTEPVSSEPASEDTTEPVSSEPASEDTTEPTSSEPASEDTTEPTSSEPASEDTTEPVSSEPTSEEPTEKPTSSSVKNKKVSGFKMKKCTTSTVTFKWRKLKGISGYEISVYKNKKWTVVGKSGSKATTKTIKKLAKGTKYKFRIRGYKKSSGKKIYTKSVTCKVVTRPAKIKIKTVKRYTTKAKIRWNKVKASGYEIKYSTSKNFKNSKKVLINKKNVTGNMVTNLKKKKYYFKVRSYVLLNGKKYYGSYSKVKRI